MESNQYVVDSSLFVAFYYEGDSYHTDAVDIMQTIDGADLIVHPYIIQETATVLTYKFGPKTAKNFLDDITNSKNIRISLVDVVSDIQSFLEIKKKVSFADSTLVSLAKRTGANLITFDKQMIALFKAI
jgi:predicted nucleic acid-binding protein